MAAICTPIIQISNFALHCNTVSLPVHQILHINESSPFGFAALEKKRKKHKI